MEVLELHRWDVSCREAGEIQRKLRERLVLSALEGEVSTVAGADVSFSRRDRKVLVGAVVLMDIRGFGILEQAVSAVKVEFPYVPGYLTFREAPALIPAFRRLRLRPDVVVFDGQGIAHPRGFGLAAHMGLILGIPSFGCAKKRLVGEHEEVGESVGSRVPLTHEGRRIGSVVRTRAGVKPVFISPGHLIDIDGAVDLTLRCLSRYRLPEPTRLAHQLTQRLRRERP